jgi:hypothetical protein
MRQLQNNIWDTISRIGGMNTKIIKTEISLHLNSEVFFLILFTYCYFIFLYIYIFFFPLLIFYFYSYLYSFLFFSFNPFYVSLMLFQLKVD